MGIHQFCPPSGCGKRCIGIYTLVGYVILTVLNSIPPSLEKNDTYYNELIKYGTFRGYIGISIMMIRTVGAVSIFIPSI